MRTPATTVGYPCISKQTAVYLLMALLVSCNHSDDNSSDTDIPIIIGGKTTPTIVGGLVSITSLDDSNETIIGSGKTGRTGQYSIGINSATGTFRVCVEGSDTATYTSWLDDKAYPYIRDHSLCAVNVTGTNNQTNVNYLTHTATGLYQYSRKAGSNNTNSILNANARINSLLLDEPGLVTASDSTSTSLELVVGGIFKLTEYLRARPGNSGYTTFDFIQDTWNDIAHDGMINLLACAECNLNSDVTANSYRHDIAANIFTYIDNKSAYTPASVSDIALHWNNAVDPMFGDNAVIDFNYTEPLITNITLDNNQAINGQYILSADITDIYGLTGVQYLIDGSTIEYSHVGSQYLITLNTQTLIDGDHEFIIQAQNGLGGESSRVIPFTVVNQQTSITLDQNDGLYISGVFALRGIATDPYSEIISMEYIVNGQATTTPFPLSRALPSIAVDTALYADGPIRMGFRSTNDNGFQLDADIEAVIDNTRPSITVSTINDGDIISGLYTFNYTGNDNIGLGHIELSLNGTSIDAESDNNVTPPTEIARTVTDYDTSQTGDGYHLLTAIAQDRAGNIVIDSTRTIGVDNTAPALTILEPIEGSIATGTFTVKADTSDTVGIDVVEVRMLDIASGAEFEITRLNGGIDSFLFTTGSFTDGAKTIKILAHDLAGFVTQKQVSFTIQN